ncbi:unnamed protein product, partial [Rotaria sp. Silwood2]
MSPIGESTGMYWRKISGSSPIGESTEGILAKDQWTFAIGESPIYESPIGEHPATPWSSSLLGNVLDLMILTGLKSP